MRLELQKRTYNDSAIVFLAFMLGVTLHMILYFTVLNFSRAIRLYPDELRYYDIARSLFNGHGLNIRNLPSGFQKIGCSLIMMPFFAVNDVILRLKMINIANIILINLSVIPVWLICNEIGLNRRSSYCILFFTAIWPDMMYGYTYMSESLYWPLFLLLVYLWLLNERRQSYVIAFTEGIICYLCYLTKEIALAFVLSHIAFEIIYPFLERRHFIRKRFIILAVFLMSFMSCNIIMKLTLFYGLGNSYNQMGIQAVMSLYKFLYMIYAFFYHMSAIFAAGLIVPFVYPAVNFRFMNISTRKLFCYVMLYLIIASAAIAYTVLVREHLGSVKMTLYMRYLGASLLVSVIAFFSCMQSVSREDIAKRRGITFLAVILVTLWVFMMFKGITLNSSVDQFWLLWYLAIDMKIRIMYPPDFTRYHAFDMRTGSLNLPDDPKKIIYLSGIIANFLIILAVYLVHRAYIKKGSEHARKTFSVILLAVCIAVNIGACQVMDFAYHVDSEAVNEVIAINKYFEDDNNSEIMYLSYGEPKRRYDRSGRLMDTYIDRRHNFYCVRDTTLTGQMKDNTAVISEIKLRGEYTGTYSNVKAIDYIIQENQNSMGQRKLMNVEIVPELSGKHFTVYRNMNPSVIQFE